MSKTLLLTLSMFTLVFTGCSKEPETVAREAPRPVSVGLNGDVFIVTRGGENIKLGLVTVTAVPETAMLSYVQIRNALADNEHLRLRPQINQARETLATARAVENSANDAYERTIQSGSSTDEAWDKYKRAGERSRQQQAALTSLLDADAYLDSPAFFFENVPAGVCSAKTDADGKFGMALPPGARVALVARAQRQVMDKTEEYYWMVWVTPQQGQPTRVFLSNDNLLTVPSTESVLLAVDRKRS